MMNCCTQQKKTSVKGECSLISGCLQLEDVINLLLNSFQPNVFMIPRNCIELTLLHMQDRRKLQLLITQRYEL